MKRRTGMKKNKKEKKKYVFETLGFFFGKAYKFRKSYFFLSAIKTVCSAIVPFADIIILPMIIDELINGRDFKKILIYIICMAGISFVLNSIVAVIDSQNEKSNDLFQNYFSELFARKCMEMPFEYTENKTKLDEIEKARTGLKEYSGGVHGLATSFFTIISNIITLLGTVAIILIYSPVLIPIIIVLLVISGIANKKMQNIELSINEQFVEAYRPYNYYVFQIMDFKYGKDLRLYNASKIMLNKTKTSIDKITTLNSQVQNRSLPFRILYSIISVLRDDAAYFVLGSMAIRQIITLGIFTELFSAIQNFHDSLNSMILSIQEIILNSKYAYYFVEFYKSIDECNKETVNKTGFEHSIEFKNVDFTYPGTENKIFNNFSFKINKGEKLSVVGMNGSGKTTFIKLLCRLYPVNSGEILIDGININEIDEHDYRNLISVVFQDFSIFAFSVKENIAFENNISEKELDRVLNKANLKDKIKALPNHADTFLSKQFNEDGVDFSGGEKQKVAIARALYKDSPLMILDEPTAALDPVSEYEIYMRFNDMVKNKTAIYVSHRMSSCKFCDHIAVFNNGSIVEYGTHDELMDIDNGMYKEMFNAQAQYYV